MNHIEAHGLVNYALKNGGTIKPLIVPNEKTDGTGLMNPSVCVTGNNILVNVRHVNYTLYHSENKGFPHFWGPLQYIHPEDDMNLRTENFICHLDEDLDVKETYEVDMKFNQDPVWHFVGLEDARLFKWDGKLYMCGVRRDHIDNKGTGRMDLSEIEFHGNKYVEVSRNYIKSTNEEKAYCEKNWMPILNMPYHFIKWSNPTEVAFYNHAGGKETIQAHLDEEKKVDLPRDLRGGSQVFEWNDHYLAFTHEVYLYNDHLGRKDGQYMHRLVAWDKEWNIVNYSDIFSFMKGEIEFVTGAALFKDDILITFGFQDNSAYILKMPQSVLMKLLVNEVNCNEE